MAIRRYQYGYQYQTWNNSLNNGLIVAWKLDEASGVRYPTVGGSAFDLTDVNTVGTADAPVGIGGLCATFDGSTEYLYCNDPFAPPTGLSVSCWWYANSDATSRALVTHDRHTSSPDRSWGLYYKGGGSGPSLFMSSNGTTFSESAAAAGGLSTWHHAVGVWDGVAITTYQNIVASTPTAFTGPLWNTAAPLRIGAFANGTTPTAFWPGRLAQLLIWRRALTLTEITYLYNSGNGRPLSDWLGA